MKRSRLFVLRLQDGPCIQIIPPKWEAGMRSIIDGGQGYIKRAEEKEEEHNADRKVYHYQTRNPQDSHRDSYRDMVDFSSHSIHGVSRGTSSRGGTSHDHSSRLGSIHRHSTIRHRTPDALAFLDTPLAS